MIKCKYLVSIKMHLTTHSKRYREGDINEIKRSLPPFTPNETTRCQFRFVVEPKDRKDESNNCDQAIYPVSVPAYAVR